MINIKNFTIFKCSINESFHWSKLPKLKDLMKQDWLNLYNADLSKADLSKADLRYADLRYANLYNANLYNADLRYANLYNADLYNADLSKADLRYADLRYANLYNANLHNADLRYANLYNADLSKADLRYADLSKTDLRYANLYNADLSKAKLKPIEDKEVIIEDFMSVSGLGSANRQTLIFKTNIGTVIQCGCFYGTEKDFKKQVKKTHGTNNYAKEYQEMLKLARIRFNRGGNE